MPDSSQDFEPRRFQSTVPYYARYRLPYPDRLIRRVVALTGMQGGDRVLDLGCGPGLLAIPFAREGMAVTGVDPEPGMLQAAREEADKAGVAVDLLQGSSFDLPAGLGPFRLAAMGRSFHWMDREQTLGVLDSLVEPGGALALFEDRHPDTVENRWRRILLAVAERYGSGNAPHRKARNQADYRAHVAVLLESPFCVLDVAGVVVVRDMTVDDIVGLAYSTSVSAHQELGDRREAFEAELRKELMALSPDGRFREIAEVRALVARRAG
jgi:SAM-dependent methyltransferase